MKKQDACTETTSLVDVLEASLRDRKNPAAIAKRERQALFLHKRIFKELPTLTSFDSPSIASFTAENFLKVLARCQEVGVTVIGVEVFKGKNQLVDIHIPERDSNLAHISYVQGLLGQDELRFNATYSFEGVCMNATDRAVTSD